MLTILYSPHMTSVDNENRLASGHADTPLSSTGLIQARELGQHYVDYPLDAVFCSDLQRARTTAEIAFAGRGLPIKADARLREYDYGDLTQHPVAEVEPEFARRIDEPFPHGESLRDVIERVGAFLSDILPQYDGKTVAVIDHRATRYALEYWYGDQTLEAIIAAEWEWRDVPIWRYELDADHFRDKLAAWNPTIPS